MVEDDADAFGCSEAQRVRKMIKILYHSMPFYIVTVGRVPGIYSSWEEASVQVNAFSGAVYRKVATMPTEPEKPKIKLKIKPKIKPRIQPPVQVQVPAPVPATQSKMEARYYAHKDYIPDGPIHIYTDGSTFNNGKKNATGGYGVFFACDIPNISRRLSTGKITNNVAELQAIHDALEYIYSNKIKDTIIHYDSEYAADVTLGRKKAHVNVELVKKCQDLYSLVQGYQGLNVEFKHIRSHTGNDDLHSIGNEVADLLAKG